MTGPSNGKATSDETRVGLIFSKATPAKRGLTLQLTNDHFVIPPGVPDVRVEARGTLSQRRPVIEFLSTHAFAGKEL